MAVDDLYAEIVRIRPKAGAEPRLLEIRDDLVQSYRDTFPGFVSARLLRPEEGGTWVDLWYWKGKGDAEEALADTSRTPLFEEWGTLVDVEQFEWAEVLTDH
jgi:Antibiotic biosynthesis monooxygenase